MNDLLTAHMMTRRRALKMAAATGSMIALHRLHGRASSVRAQDAASSSANGRPKLRIAVPGLPAGLDPHRHGGGISQRIQSIIFDTLIGREVTSTGSQLVPGIATEWKRIDDTTVELTLRDDVTFQDGTPLTSADIVFTFERILERQPDLWVSDRGVWPIDHVEALDEYRVRFTTPAPDPFLEARFAAPFGLSGYALPAAYFKEVGADAFDTAPIGTGPFRLIEWLPDESARFVAHDGYFGGSPNASEVIIRSIPETATRIAVLLNDEVDMVVALPPDQLAAIEDRENLTVRSVPSSALYMLVFNAQAAPTDKAEVRQALGLAIDRQAIVDGLFGGYGEVTRGFQVPVMQYLNADRPLTPYEPEKAKELLQSAGYAGEPIILVSYAPDYYQLERSWSEAIIAMWQAVGINAKLEFIEASQSDLFYSRENTRTHASTFAVSTPADPAQYLVFQWGSPDNWLQTSGVIGSDAVARYNELARQAAITVDGEQRYAIYQEMLDEFDAQAFGTPLFSVRTIYAMNVRVDYTPTDGPHLDLRPANLKFTS